jgi:hypothetical protein
MLSRQRPDLRERNRRGGDLGSHCGLASHRRQFLTVLVQFARCPWGELSKIYVISPSGLCLGAYEKTPLIIILLCYTIVSHKISVYWSFWLRAPLHTSIALPTHSVSVKPPRPSLGCCRPSSGVNLRVNTGQSPGVRKVNGSGFQNENLLGRWAPNRTLIIVWKEVRRCSGGSHTPLIPRPAESRQ